MIVRLAGQLLEKQPDHAVIDVHGVGYHVWLTLNCYEVLPAVGAETALKIYHQIREDGQALFGFVDDQEHDLFTHLIGISGIGAKTAISMLSGALPDDFKRRVIDGDEEALTAIRGVGPKMARRIITELRGKFEGDGAWDAAALTGAGHSMDVASRAALSLESLGYRQSEARTAVQAALKKLPPDTAVEDVIRAVLSGGRS
ncbi:MAG: Holliday junction branch migration protein RuvA [Candidatus Marinimicrobia bacterium]|nr:Holliday junction branch migration protein RuvA [Candidatus Neomarinimicrobiota bacterium]